MPQILDARWMSLPALARLLWAHVERTAGREARIRIGVEPVGQYIATLVGALPSERLAVRRLVDLLIDAGYLGVEAGTLLVTDPTRARSKGAIRTERWRHNKRHCDASRDAHGNRLSDVTVTRLSGAMSSEGEKGGAPDLDLSSGSSSASAPLKPLLLEMVSGSAGARDSNAEAIEPAKASPKRGSKADREARGTRCPSSVDEGAAAWLDSHRIPRGPEADAMLDFHAGRGTRALNWPATWRTWQRNGERFRRRGATQPVQRHPELAGETWAEGREKWAEGQAQREADFEAKNGHRSTF